MSCLGITRVVFLVGRDCFSTGFLGYRNMRFNVGKASNSILFGSEKQVQSSFNSLHP